MEQVDGHEIDVIEGTVEAPLWGMPPLDYEKDYESKLGHASAQEKGAQEDASKDT